MFSFVNEGHNVPPAHKRCDFKSSCGFKTWIVDIHLQENKNLTLQITSIILDLQEISFFIFWDHFSQDLK